MKQRAATVAVGFVLLLAASAVSARGQLQAGPTLLEILPENSSARLQLGNSGDAPVAAQIRVYAWSQEGGEDRLLESEDLVPSPPIADVAVGADQLVRIVRTGPAPADGRDHAYRVVVDELPGPPEEAASGVNVRMRYVIPVFVRAAGASEPQLSCRLLDGGNRLSCRNTGGRPAQVGASTLRAGDTTLVLSEGLYGYVLPESERQWTLPAERPAFAGGVTLETRINGQPAEVAVERVP